MGDLQFQNAKNLTIVKQSDHAVFLQIESQSSLGQIPKRFGQSEPRVEMRRVFIPVGEIGLFAAHDNAAADVVAMALGTAVIRQSLAMTTGTVGFGDRQKIAFEFVRIVAGKVIADFLFQV